MSTLPARAAAWISAWPVHTKVLVALGLGLVAVELALRSLAPRSRLYARWTAALETVGAVWTAVILSVIYFVSVAGVSAFMRLRGHDLLDRRLAPEPTFWRPHEPNPLGALAAARHQF